MFDTRLTLVLVVLLALGEACGTGVQPGKKQSAPAVPETSPAVRQSEPAPSEAVQSVGAKPNHFSLDTGRQASQPVPERVQPNIAPPPPPSKTKPAGPPGYITRKNVALLAEPASNATPIATLNQYENVYILETIFTDEAGRESEYPTWYKVERENKQQGWVKGGLLNAGGGG